MLACYGSKSHAPGAPKQRNRILELLRCACRPPKGNEFRVLVSPGIFAMPVRVASILNGICFVWDSHLRMFRVFLQWVFTHVRTLHHFSHNICNVSELYHRMFIDSSMVCALLGKNMEITRDLFIFIWYLHIIPFSYNSFAVFTLLWRFWATERSSTQSTLLDLILNHQLFMI